MTANTTWSAKGRARALLAAMRAEPERIFTAKEAAEIMGCPVDAVAAAIKYSLMNKAMFCHSFGRGFPMLLRGTPIPPEMAAGHKESRKPRATSQTWKEGGTVSSNGWPTDPADHRISKVDPAWKPPVMRHVRGGA